MASGKVFVVERVVDIKWKTDAEEDERNYDKALYRVRWRDFPPAEDSWEPMESFISSSKKIAEDFVKQYEEMLIKQEAELPEACHEDILPRSKRTVNIFSREIEQIVQKRIEKTITGGPLKVIYKVKWKNGSPKKKSWEPEENLKHAQDKIEEYSKKRWSRGTSGRAVPSVSSNEDSERRSGERKFWESIDKGDILQRQVDMYTGIKNRRKKMEHGSETENVDEKPSCSSVDSMASPSKQLTPTSFLASLPKHDPEKVKADLEEQAKSSMKLTAEEFSDAVNRGDYQKVYKCLRGTEIPDVDLPKLFLWASRLGLRDVALLLATRVEDLTVEDDYGHTALTMAACKGDTAFAHQLLLLGVPLDTPTSQDLTPRSVAREFNQSSFLTFLQKYSDNELPF